MFLPVHFMFWHLVLGTVNVSDDKAKGLCEETAGATLEHRHQLMNTEATVDNNIELFEAQRVEEIKV